jgi:hypothetical protein
MINTRTIKQTIEQITDPPKLDQHILRSYSMLRWCMGVFALMLPLLLVVGGINSLWWIPAPLEIQNSLSAYYHAGSTCTSLGGVYRDLFVGILVALSLCLFIYKGFGKLEDFLLNIAAISLVCVAFFPMDWPEPQKLPECRGTPDFAAFTSSKLLGLPISIHFASASIFFIMLILVNIFTAMNTVDSITDAKKKRFWIKIYRYSRWLMPISLGLVWLLCIITRTERLVLWLEWAGIWAFSIYWLLKSIEILSTKIDEEMIVSGKVKWVDNNDTANTSLPPVRKLRVTTNSLPNNPVGAD